MKFDLEKVQKAMDNVPFGNSVFQINNFTSGKETPERRYKYALLQIHQKLEAMQTAKFMRDRAQIDIDEIEEKIEKSTNEFEKRRLEVDYQEKTWSLQNSLKLIKDAEIEILTHYNIFEECQKLLPENFSRKEFEEAELGYWQKRLVGEAKNQLLLTGTVEIGTSQALKDIGIRILGKNEHGQLVWNMPTNLIEE